MYCTEKVDILEYFRAEFSQFLSIVRSYIAQDIHNRGGQCEARKYLISLPIYRQMYDIVSSLSNTEHVFPRAFLA